MGAAMLVGGWGRERQQVRRRGRRRAGDDAAAGRASRWCCRRCSCSRAAASCRSSATRRRTSRRPSSTMSFAVAIVLLLLLLRGPVVLAEDPSRRLQPGHRGRGRRRASAWSVRRSVGAAGRAPAWPSASCRRSSSARSRRPPRASACRRSSSALIIVAIVGNAAEHWVAVYFASRDKMDIAIAIAIGSSAQIALFVMPVLVLLSFVIGPFPMALEFSGLELGAILLAVLIAVTRVPGRRVDLVRGRAAARGLRRPRRSSSTSSRRPALDRGSGSSSSSSSASSSSGSSRADGAGAARLEGLDQLVALVLVDRRVVAEQDPLGARRPPRPRSARGRRGRSRRPRGRSRSPG